MAAGERIDPVKNELIAVKSEDETIHD